MKNVKTRSKETSGKPFDIIKEEITLGDNFFKKYFVDISSVELYLIKSVFESDLKMANFTMMCSATNKKFIVDTTLLSYRCKEYQNLLETFRKAFDGYSEVLGLDNKAKIGEVAIPSYKSAENFSIVIPLDISNAIPLLSRIYKFRLPDTIEALTHQFECDPRFKQEHDDNLEEVHRFLYSASTPFYKKMLSFCNIQVADKIFEKIPYAKFVANKSTFLEIRII